MPYNGWSNYETWVTKLWLDNDEYTQERMVELAEEYRGNRYDLGYALKGFVADTILGPTLEGATLAAELLGHAFGSVDWDEIAENLLSELPDEDEEEDEEDEEEA